jgi:hypothetical protein
MGWEMAKTMHCIVMQSIKVVVQKVKYIVVGCDEVITINQSWGIVHVYIVDGFKKMPLLMNFERVLTKSTIDNLPN